MERWVRKRFMRDFLRLPEQKQREVLELMREFERARETKGTRACRERSERKEAGRSGCSTGKYHSI